VCVCVCVCEGEREGGNKQRTLADSNYEGESIVFGR
jgi:hypothetical protein